MKVSRQRPTCIGLILVSAGIQGWNIGSVSELEIQYLVKSVICSSNQDWIKLFDIFDIPIWLLVRLEVAIFIYSCFMSTSSGILHFKYLQASWYNACMTQTTTSSLWASIRLVFLVPQRRQPQEFPFHMSTLGLMSWIWSENLGVKLSTLTPLIYSYFSNPLYSLPGVMFGQSRGETRGREGDPEWWVKTQSIHAAVRPSLLASHLFPFWCLLSTRCQRIWSPRMGSGLFSSGSLANPAISYLYWFIPYFLQSLSFLSLKPSPVFNFAVGLEGWGLKNMYFGP